MADAENISGHCCDAEPVEAPAERPRFHEHAQKYVDAFMAAIEPVKELYQRNAFSYLAVRSGDGFVIVQATLYLHSSPLTFPLGRFESANVKAGHFMMSETGMTCREFVEQIATGKLTTPHGDFLFPQGSGMHSATYRPFHDVGLQQQRRVGHLAILGAQTAEYLHPNQPQLDWEIRGAETPYDGVQELLTEFQPGTLNSVIRIEVAALDLVAIDQTSVVEGEVAKIVVRAIQTTQPARVSAGFRVMEQGRVVQRGNLKSEDFEWQILDDRHVGTAEVAVPKAAVVHAFAKHDGIVYHHYYFGDPTSFQNPRRAAYEAFDPRFEIMNDILAQAQAQRPNSKDFEAAMPWLFWMLGFAPAHVGGPSRTSDAADFLVSAPNGNIAVVECTVGLLKEQNKLPKLHDRAEAVRRNLETSSTRHLRIVPIIITAKTAAEVRPDLEQAEKLGIYVITREGIERLIQQTLFPQNADQLYEQTEQAIAAAKAKHESLGI